ncbi:MAG TPA: YtxH domain-containing protein [Cyclobacteriaceae bacterium]|jgi:gas vesicle protein|nr:YtxH domain-containing protein [Cyclobacteriaceae bacterium]
MNTTTKVILGLTAAAAAGAAIGLLLAPEKGSDLRKKIKDGAKNLMNDFSTLLATGKDLVNDLQDTLLERNDDTRELIESENNISKN